MDRTYLWLGMGAVVGGFLGYQVFQKTKEIAPQAGVCEKAGIKKPPELNELLEYVLIGAGALLGGFAGAFAADVFAHGNFNLSPDNLVMWAVLAGIGGIVYYFAANVDTSNGLFAGLLTTTATGVLNTGIGIACSVADAVVDTAAGVVATATDPYVADVRDYRPIDPKLVFEGEYLTSFDVSLPVKYTKRVSGDADGEGVMAYADSLERSVTDPRHARCLKFEFALGPPRLLKDCTQTETAQRAYAVWNVLDTQGAFETRFSWRDRVASQFAFDAATTDNFFDLYSYLGALRKNGWSDLSKDEAATTHAVVQFLWFKLVSATGSYKVAPRDPYENPDGPCRCALRTVAFYQPTDKEYYTAYRKCEDVRKADDDQRPRYNAYVTCYNAKKDKAACAQEYSMLDDWYKKVADYYQCKASANPQGCVEPEHADTATNDRFWSMARATEMTPSGNSVATGYVEFSRPRDPGLEPNPGAAPTGGDGCRGNCE